MGEKEDLSTSHIESIPICFSGQEEKIADIADFGEY